MISQFEYSFSQLMLARYHQSPVDLYISHATREISRCSCGRSRETILIFMGTRRMNTFRIVCDRCIDELLAIRGEEIEKLFAQWMYFRAIHPDLSPRAILSPPPAVYYSIGTDGYLRANIYIKKVSELPTRKFF